MKYDVVVAGVGGQGVVSIAATVARAARRSGLHVKQSEVHGMAQRGGDLTAQVRIADAPVRSELIPFGTADLLIAMEPLEALRNLPMLSREGTIVSAAEPVENFPNYPPAEALLARLRAIPGAIVLEADRLAKRAGSPKVVNTVLVGAASHLLPVPPKAIEGVLRDAFGPKGEKVLFANLEGFRLGREAFPCVGTP